MSLLTHLKSMFGGSKSAPSATTTTMDEPAAADTHDHDHEGHDHGHEGHSHEPMGSEPVEPTQD